MRAAVLVSNLNCDSLVLSFDIVTEEKPDLFTVIWPVKVPPDVGTKSPDPAASVASADSVLSELTSLIICSTVLAPVNCPSCVETAVAILSFPSYGIIISIYKLLTEIWNLVN
jgi:hypothetical protein